MSKRKARRRSPRGGAGRIARWVVALILMAGTSILGFGLIEFLQEGTYFELRDIEITGARRVTDAEIVGCLNVQQGDNLLLVNRKEVRDRVEARPWIRRARVGKRLPNTLWIEVEERTPIALLNNAREQILFGLDEEGYVLPPLPKTEMASGGYLVVTGVPAAICFPGNLIEFPATEPVPAVVAAIRGSLHLKEVVSEIHWEAKQGYVLYPRFGSRMLLLGKSRASERVSLLDQAWAFLSEEAIQTQYVDARFETQGVVFQAESLPEGQWLAYLEKETTAPRKVAAALGDLP